MCWLPFYCNYGKQSFCFRLCNSGTANSTLLYSKADCFNWDWFCTWLCLTCSTPCHALLGLLCMYQWHRQAPSSLFSPCVKSSRAFQRTWVFLYLARSHLTAILSMLRCLLLNTPSVYLFSFVRCHLWTDLLKLSSFLWTSAIAITLYQVIV